jgi:hypothetical protein
VIRRLVKNLTLLEPTDAPEESVQLERDGYARLRGVFDPTEVARMREEIDGIFDATAPERVRGDKDEFRYEMFNRGAACQAAVMHPEILRVVEPLLGEDCHVIANTAWRNPPEFRGGVWHCDAGPHVPRPEGVPWDDRIPYPVFAVATHVYLQDCTRRSSTTPDQEVATAPRQISSGQLSAMPSTSSVRPSPRNTAQHSVRSRISSSPKFARSRANSSSSIARCSVANRSAYSIASR